jgi:hypothetical protein
MVVSKPMIAYYRERAHCIPLAIMAECIAPTSTKEPASLALSVYGGSSIRMVRRANLPVMPEDAFDFVQVVVAVQRAVEAEVIGRSLDLRIKFGGDCRELGVGRFSGGKTKLDSDARFQRQAQGAERIVDHIRVDRGLVHAMLLPAVQQDEHAVVPEGQVGQ